MAVRPAKTLIDCPTPHIHTEVELFTSCVITLVEYIMLSRQRTTKALIRVRRCAGSSAALLFAYGINSFSHDMAQMTSIHALVPLEGLRHEIAPFMKKTKTGPPIKTVGL